MELKLWRGLLRKEWVYMKWPVIALVLINLVITVVEIIPIDANFLNGNLVKILTSGNAWFNLNLYMGVFLLLISLLDEMKRPDIWLHSHASIRQLVGAKILFAGLAVTCSLLLCGVVTGVFGVENSSVTEVLMLMATIGAIVLNTVYIIIVVFFAWSVYQVLRSRNGLLAIIAMIVLVPVSTFLWAVLWFTNWFQSIKEIGPILDLSTMTVGLPYLRETNLLFAGLMPESTLMTVGSLLLYIVISSVLFIGGTTLFEKKVRL